MNELFCLIYKKLLEIKINFIFKFYLNGIKFKNNCLYFENSLNYLFIKSNFKKRRFANPRKYILKKYIFIYLRNS